MMFGGLRFGRFETGRTIFSDERGSRTARVPPCDFGLLSFSGLEWFGFVAAKFGWLGRFVGLAFVSDSD